MSNNDGGPQHGDKAPDEIIFFRRGMLFATLTTYAFSNLAFRLLRKRVQEPGFADELEQIGIEIVRELKNAVPTGFSIDDEAKMIGQAAEQVRKHFEKWVGEIRQKTEPTPL
jgi:hypothetical protein